MFRLMLCAGSEDRVYPFSGRRALLHPFHITHYDVLDGVVREEQLSTPIHNSHRAIDYCSTDLGFSVKYRLVIIARFSTWPLCASFGGYLRPRIRA